MYLRISHVMIIPLRSLPYAQPTNASKDHEAQASQSSSTNAAQPMPHPMPIIILLITHAAQCRLSHLNFIATSTP